MTSRFAIYYAPALTDPLWEKAIGWLGSDPASGNVTGADVAGIARGELAGLTRSATRYGFHATIKPPMFLAPGRTQAELEQALADFARRTAPVALGHLHLASIEGFLALIEKGDNASLQQLAADIVTSFEPFRAPLAEKDREARRARGLSPRQEELLDAYGYPYVLDEFRFHMTLTDRLDAATGPRIRAAAEEWFGPLLAQEVTLDRVVLYEEPVSGAPFRRLSQYELRA